MLMDRLGMEEDVPIEHPWVTRAVENAQKKVEERNFDIRKHLLEYDDVMNQQRKSIYTLRRQVLEGHYQSVPTEDEAKKGVKPASLAKNGPSSELREHIAPIVRDMLRVHGAPMPPDDMPPEQIASYREKVMQMPIAELGELRTEPLERDVYTWFGCPVSLEDVKKQPSKAHERLENEVALSLTEQQERLLDVLDEIVSTMVERSCPPKKHWEDWDVKGLKAAFEEQFGISADESITRMTDANEVAVKLYEQAEEALKKKEQDFQSTHFLRLFRTLFLQEIDRQWLEHLSHMDHLRDGIGLRGYGQRDPKKEYKREGYDLFVQTLQGVKASVVDKMFHVQRLTEREVAEAEAQRRRQVEARQQAISAQHPGQADEQPDAPRPQQPPQGQRVMVAARHSAVAQQAALAAQARRLAAMQAQGQGGQPQQPQAAAGAPATAEAQQRALAEARARAEQAARAQAVVAARQQRAQLPKLGRNDPCHCGSGKKYKNCHMKDDQALQNG
jgi:preprotein translocase subunit SecA